MINTNSNTSTKKKMVSKNIFPQKLPEKDINNNSNELTSISLPKNSNISQKSEKNLINIIISKDNQEKKAKSNKEVIRDKNKKKENINKNMKESSKEKDKEREKEKLIKAQKRLNIINLLNSDNFAENFMYYPCKNEITKFEQNPDYSISIPYSSLFYDNIFLRDESIFFIHDKSQKFKFLDEADTKKISSEDIKLNFGEDPSDIYYQILRGEYKNNLNIDKLQEHLDNFNLFKCRIPNYMNINMENFRENELYNIRNNLYNDQNSYNESLNSTRINSNINKNNENFQFNQREFLLNNEMFEEDSNKEENNINKTRFIRKKRKSKR